MTILADLGARALRKLGVAIVADANRQSAGVTVSADAVAALSLRELGIVIPEAQRATSYVTVSTADLAARTLRALGVNPIATGSQSAATTLYTGTDVANRALRRVGVNQVAEANAAIAATTYGQSEVAYRALRELGVNPINDGSAAVHATTYAASEVAFRSLRALGVNPVAEGSEAAHTTTTTTQDVGDRALRTLGVNPSSQPAGSYGAGATVATAVIAAAALIKLEVYASGDTSSASYSADLTEAMAKVTAVHEILAEANFVTWYVSAIPAWATEYYVTLTAHFLAPEFGKTSDLAAYQQVMELMRRQALSGPSGRTFAAATAVSVHEGLAAQNLVTWNAASIPAAVAEDYVLMVADLLAPVYVTTVEKAGYSSAQSKQVDRTIYTAAEGRIRLFALSGTAGQQIALDKVTAVHESLAAQDLVSFAISAIPASLIEYYVDLVTYFLAADYGKQTDPDAYKTAMDMVRMQALAGSAGQALAMAKVVSVHEDLAARALVTWPITAIPASSLEYYVILTAQVLGPNYGKPFSAESYGAAMMGVRMQALSGASGLVIALEKATAVHESLAARNLTSWGILAIPASVVEDYAIMASSLLMPVYSPALSAAEDQAAETAAYVAAETRVKMVALSGAAGQQLALDKVSAVHDSLTADGLTSWGVSAVPQAYAEDYVVMASTLLAPVMGKEPSGDAYTAAMERVKRGGIVAGAQVRALSQVQSVHEEVNALGLVTWTSATIPPSVADAYQAMTTAALGPAFGKDFDQKAYDAARNRIRLVAMGGPAGQALAQQKVVAIHSDLDARGWARWSLFDIPDYAQEPYVLMAASLLGPEVGVKPDPNWMAQGEMALARLISLPDSGLPTQACYF